MWKSVLSGLLVTLKISVLSVLFGTLLGVGICRLRMSRFRALRVVSGAYIAVLRGMPVLMLLMMMYYVVFARTDIEADIIAVITFSLNSSAYFAELMRSALLASDKGQVEAARTLGFSRIQAFFLVSLPQAVEIARPVYESTVINLIQWTSVVGYVTITDLTRVINTASSRTMQPVIMICVGMLLYLGVAYLVKALFYFTGKIKKNKLKGAE
jgi:amine acid ABC transporter, permease protein, 3-TM region, His/Glu/Gln/Arg/opine family